MNATERTLALNTFREPPSRSSLIRSVMYRFNRSGVKERSDRIEIVALLINRQVTSIKELTDEELHEVLKMLDFHLRIQRVRFLSGDLEAEAHAVLKIASEVTVEPEERETRLFYDVR